MGFWHTGYAEFHEVTGLGTGGQVELPQVVFACNQCSQHFMHVEELRRHRFEQHPVRQPALLVKGTAVGSLRFNVFHPLSPADVAAEDSARCMVNGVPVVPGDLGLCLSRMTSECVEIVLENDGAVTRCKLDFRIAVEAHLDGVEAAFMRMAGYRALDMDAVARFIRECEAYPTAMPYCDGICHYLYGVMAKEGSLDSDLLASQYAERFLMASEELAGFDRSLALGIRSLVAFHFNRFADAAILSADRRLRHAASAFSGLLSGGSLDGDAASWDPARDVVGSLLTDQDTGQILAYATGGVDLLARQSTALVARLRRSSGYDRLKYLLLASEALAAQDDAVARATARRLVREVATHDDAGPWAQGMLERL